MTALHLHAQLQSLINSIPVGVCEVYTLESLIESQWPSTADRGMIFFDFCCCCCCCCFVLLFVVLVVVLCLYHLQVSRCLWCAHNLQCSDSYTQLGASTHYH